MEDAIANYYSSRLLDGQEPVEFHKHESVSKHVLKLNRELNGILTANQFSPEHVYQIFKREPPPAPEPAPRFANLVSSDLDADRIDYLMRTAHYTGLPYGSVDLAYLLSQLRFDEKQRLCLTSKALRTADHFLLSRYFDYQQVAFHKTVAAFEWILKDLLAILLRDEQIDGSAQWVDEAIANGDWELFDDAAVIEKIRRLAASAADSVTRQKAVALLDRKPPKLLAEVEYIAESTERNWKAFQNEKQLLKTLLETWSSELQIPLEAWHLWDPRVMTLTKIGSHIPVSDVMEGPETERDRDRYEQAVRILNQDGRTSQAIMEKSSSLMSVLSNHALYAFRLYVLLSEDRGDRAEAIRKRIEKDLPGLSWK